MPSGHLGAIYAVSSGSEARISVGFGGDWLAVRPNMGLVVPIPKVVPDFADVANPSDEPIDGHPEPA